MISKIQNKIHSYIYKLQHLSTSFHLLIILHNIFIENCIKHIFLEIDMDLLLYTLFLQVVDHLGDIHKLAFVFLDQMKD
jgi:hypothetical protein